MTLTNRSAPLKSYASGAIVWTDGNGNSGVYSLLARGLAAAGTVEGNVVDDPANEFNSAGDVGFTLHYVSVPPGAALQRFALFDGYTNGNDDLDLYVYNPQGVFIAGSFSGASAEQVDVVNPVAGSYRVYVHGWETD